MSREEVLVSVLTDIRRELVARRDDLRWCRKVDFCHEKAAGVTLALADFDAIILAHSELPAAVLALADPDE